MPGWGFLEGVKNAVQNTVSMTQEVAGMVAGTSSYNYPVNDRLLGDDSDDSIDFILSAKEERQQQWNRGVDALTEQFTEFADDGIKVGPAHPHLHSVFEGTMQVMEQSSHASMLDKARLVISKVPVAQQFLGGALAGVGLSLFGGVLLAGAASLGAHLIPKTKENKVAIGNAATKVMGALDQFPGAVALGGTPGAFLYTAGKVLTAGKTTGMANLATRQGLNVTPTAMGETALTLMETGAEIIRERASDFEKGHTGLAAATANLVGRAAESVANVKTNRDEQVGDNIIKAGTGLSSVAGETMKCFAKTFVAGWGRPSTQMFLREAMELVPLSAAEQAKF